MGFFILSLFITSAFAAIGPIATLNIVNDNVSPDGFTRAAVLADGTYPGPLIQGSKGDNFKLNVVDQLQDDTMLRSTTIHWHGLFQANSSWADGVAFVTQCPIAPGNSFLYDFNIPGQAGTFWYHSHLSTQYCDGLRGPLVVYDPSDPHKSLYDVDDESTIITLSDWYHTPAKAAGPLPVPDSTLINGKGRYSGGPDSDLFRLTVVEGQRYRLRIVSLSCHPNWVFSIDGHDLTIIEVDGENVQPLVVDSIQVFAGQRYSAILTANKASDNYWIRANPDIGTPDFDNAINSAVLHYASAGNGQPTNSTPPTLANTLLEANLHPLTDPAAPGLPQAGGADVTLTLDLAFDATTFTFTVNGVSWVNPTAPVLLQILSGASDPNDLLPAGSLYQLPKDKVIELIIPGLAVGAPHPFHLHGHTFSVVRSAGSTTYNYADPVRRDVVNSGTTGDEVTIRFKTDNSGPWFLHCHIDFHLEVGLAIVFAEDLPGVAGSSHPPAWDQLCPIYDALDASEL